MITTICQQRSTSHVLYGTKLVLCSGKKDGDRLLFEMLAEAAEKAEGCSVHEFPSLNILHFNYCLASGYTERSW